MLPLNKTKAVITKVREGVNNAIPKQATKQDHKTQSNTRIDNKLSHIKTT